jgi:Ca2+-binding EF-hand superfamily protein
MTKIEEKKSDVSEDELTKVFNELDDDGNGFITPRDRFYEDPFRPKNKFLSQNFEQISNRKQQISIFLVIMVIILNLKIF